MKFKLYRQYGALNSVAVFDHLANGIKKHGHEIVESAEDIAVIWSVLWQGRMAGNRSVYYECVKKQIPVLIIEVGNLIRNTTWRLSFNNVNRNGIFADDFDLDEKRPKKLGVHLEDERSTRRPEILIAAQHQKSLQWEGLPPTVQWITDITDKISKISNRTILVRPHPRNPFAHKTGKIQIQSPKKLPSSYDDFDIDYNFHVVVNHNSGPAVQAAIKGIPIICDHSSLAFPVSETWENIENPRLKDRKEWFLKLCHTEWTLEEIASGYPLERLLKKYFDF
jgi:hypothetical protein